ncbi:hypothetical protein NPIL_53501 [Nephila pilipes]|uniref:Uncharacterized protein n=1 Tax=Nephila pilipes TaxID=299642 RepID=A0A8X6PAB0_NEPPI|nr:hypothetical protein NPIL_53501 [Nephila pilipes]
MVFLGGGGHQIEASNQKAGFSLSSGYSRWEFGGWKTIQLLAAESMERCRYGETSLDKENFKELDVHGGL